MALYESKIESLPRIGKGKGRDIYAVGEDKMLIVTSDRLSAFDVVLPDPIPDKHWNLLLVTVEDSATPERPSDTHSIAGVFPNAEGQILPGSRGWDSRPAE